MLLAPANLDNDDDNLGKRQKSRGELIDFEVSQRTHALSSLRSYCRYNWISHVKEYEKGSVDGRVTELVKQFFGSMNESSSQAYQAWLNRSHMVQNERTLRSEILRPTSSASFGICMCGFEKILSTWWDEGYVTSATVFVIKISGFLIHRHDTSFGSFRLVPIYFS